MGKQKEECYKLSQSNNIPQGNNAVECVLRHKPAYYLWYLKEGLVSETEWPEYQSDLIAVFITINREAKKLFETPSDIETVFTKRKRQEMINAFPKLAQANS